MDTENETFQGPHRIQKVGTVTVPRELLLEIGIDRGHEVHWVLNPDLPGTLLPIPTRMLARAMPAAMDALREAAK